MKRLRELDNFPTPYIDSASLLTFFQRYKWPYNAIARLVKQGELIRLKNGFFLIASKIESEIPFEQIANCLYGPSYVSLEWALSYHGMIPERVREITCVTTGKKKEFTTEIGTFSYAYLSLVRYSVGIEWRGFFIASPEKALLDYLYFRKREFIDLDEFFAFTRIDEDVFATLDKKIMQKIVDIYKNRTLDQFMRLIR